MSDQVRQLIKESGMTRYRIWKETGIDQATLSRFVAGGGLSMDNLDRLADLLGLQIRMGRRRARKGK